VLLLAGAAIRAVWLTLGAFSLRRLRHTAERIDPLPPGVRAAEAKVGVRAGFYVSARITSPITFGVARPVVLVPPSVLSMDDDLQHAIACHELLHVRRRDWLTVIGEEIVRTVFWFHPAIWWLLNRIQLSREHVVDEAVVRLIESRDRYVEAMLAVALAESRVILAPAPLFLRRRSLKQRVAHILQETTMTARRLAASVALSGAALALTAALAVRAFPLEARAPQAGRAQSTPSAASTAPVEIVRGGEHLLHASLPKYPPRARERRVEGEVALEITLDDRGQVSDARVVSGPDELRRAALESVLQWHFAPDKLRSTVAYVSLKFNASARESSREDVVRVATLVSENRGPKYTFSYRQADESISGAPRLSRFKLERVPPEMAEEIRRHAGFAVGDAMTPDMIKRIRDAVMSLDEHLSVRFEPDGKGGTVLVIIAPK
jgi:TonB family protein